MASSEPCTSRLEDDVEGLLLAFANVGEQRFQRAAARDGELLLADLFEAFLAEALRAALVVHLDDFVADVGQAAEADDLGRHAGEDALDGLVAVVDESPHLAPDGSADEWLADFQSAGLDDDGGGGAATWIHAGLDDGGAHGRLRISAKVEHLGLQGHGLEQVIDAGALHGGDFHALRYCHPIPRA